MLKKYKNHLFNILKETDLGLEAFEISEERNQLFTVFLIKVKGTPMEFQIRTGLSSFDDMTYLCRSFSPSFPWTSKTALYIRDIAIISNYLIDWLNKEVKDYFEDLEEIDLWEEYKKGNHSLGINTIDFEDQSEFSASEKLQVRAAIEDYKTLVKENLKLSEPEMELVNRKLDYLIEATGRLNKFDWKSVAISTILGIAITLSMDTNTGNMLFELFKKVFIVIPKIF